MLIYEKIKIILIILALGILIATSTGCEKKEPSKTLGTNTSATDSVTATAITSTPTKTYITEIISDSPTESTVTYIDDNFISNQDPEIKFNSNDFNVYAAKYKKEIKMGMSSKELEQILGKPVKDECNKDFLNYNGIKVYFRNNKAIAFYIDELEENSSQYFTNRLVGLNNSIEGIKKAYGQGVEIKSGNNKSLTYYAKIENNKMISLDAIEYRKNPASAKDTDVFVLSFSINERNQVTLILISDDKFSQNCK